MYDYLDIRKKVLGIDQVHMFDVYAPLVKDFDRQIPYDEAWDIVMEALVPLGDEIGGILKEARENRWIDVYENRGKRSGAYSSGCYDSAPHILLNYEGKVNDVFTLAHEIGHSGGNTGTEAQHHDEGGLMSGSLHELHDSFRAPTLIRFREAVEW